jgi:adenylate kinase family enzyme
MNKGIIILGSVGSGKSYFEEELYRWTDFQEPKMFNRLDPDIWVENKDHEFYNNPLKASNYMYKTVIPNIMELPMNFILQNTGANIDTLRKIIDNQRYQFKIVIIYCNPIIAFLRNFSRERKVPKHVVLENWLKVYSQIEEYIKLVGDSNIYIYETEYTEKEQNIIYSWEDLPFSFYNFINTIFPDLNLNLNSTFKKEGKEYTLEEYNKKIQQFKDICIKIEDKLKDFEIKNNYLKPVGLDKIYIKEEIDKWINK